MVSLTPTRAKKMVSAWTLRGFDPVDTWRRQLERARFIKPKNNHTLANEVEALIIGRLEALGLYVSQTTHKCPFDLWAGPIRIEVKAAQWTQRTDRPQYGRYFANIRTHQKDIADFVIFAVKNGSWHFFIIPADAIPARALSVTSYNVEAYAGQYAPYLEAWPLVAELAKAAPARPRQLGLEGTR